MYRASAKIPSERIRVLWIFREKTKFPSREIARRSFNWAEAPSSAVSSISMSRLMALPSAPII